MLVADADVKDDAADGGVGRAIGLSGDGVTSAHCNGCAILGRDTFGIFFVQFVNVEYGMPFSRHHALFGFPLARHSATNRRRSASVVLLMFDTPILTFGNIVSPETVPCKTC